MQAGDAQVISAAFAEAGWQKPARKFEHYLMQQEAGQRHVIVTEIDGAFAGYVTILWRSSFTVFAEAGIPEISDLNVLPRLQRRGIGTALMGAAETICGRSHAIVGIGFGLTADYAAAQRLYVGRGYIPDGSGVAYRGRPVERGERLRADDDLVLYLTKRLR